jgi:hypothetical protein
MQPARFPVFPHPIKSQGCQYHFFLTGKYFSPMSVDGLRCYPIKIDRYLFVRKAGAP